MDGVCFLFGRGDTQAELLQELELALRHQVDAGVRSFVLGQWGSFETAVLSLLEKLRKENPDIAVRQLKDCAMPELEPIPKPFVRRYAHQYMAERCGSVICCPYHSGNMQNLLGIAHQRGVPVVELKNTPPRA